MSQIIVIYSFDRINPIQRKQFHRKLFGSTEKTHGGKYSCEVKGILSNIPFNRPVNSVVITDSKARKNFEKLLKEFQAKYEIYNIS